MCGADQYSTEGAVYCEDCPEGTGDVAPGEGTSVDDCRSEGIIILNLIHHPWHVGVYA